MASQELLSRTFNFALDVGKLVNRLPNTYANKAYIQQLIRCSSSVGANFWASQRAKSPKDFIYKLKIVEEEADESIYFLELLQALNPSLNEDIGRLKEEAFEILKIVVSSIRSTKTKYPNL